VVIDSQDEVPPAYPRRWEADAVLADGSTVRVRPIRPDDGSRLHDFHGRQSPESIYFRYFTARPKLSDREVEHLTHVDYEDRMAFVAVRGDRLVGVARYDRWPTRSEAEVAFFVDDAHRGRGVATLLLEYLAVAAREAGISAFTASVLPTNRRMVSVFKHAGFTTSSTFADGVIEVRLDLQPTVEAEAAIEARAEHAEAQAVRLLLAPRSVAVIGASRDRGAVGHQVLRNLLHHEFAGPVYPVNPAAEHVAGVRAVSRVDEIDGPVDLAIVAVPAAEVPKVIEGCGQQEVRAAIVLSAGFAEAGPEGEALSAATLRVARRFGIRLLGPNCLGVINTDPDVRLHATFATPDPRRGTVALLSESGTIGGVILDHMRSAGVGLSSFAAIGNRADVSANDLLQFWAEDPRTDIVLVYLESFGNPRKFSRIARGLARHKPVVVIKSGRAARAYPGDEGDLSGPALDALLRQTGIIRVDTLAQSLDVARILAAGVRVPNLPRGRRVAVVGNAGGSLVSAADACVDAGLELARLSPDIWDRLGVAPDIWPTRLRGNPLDLGFLAEARDLEQALRGVLADDEVDSVLVVCAPSRSQQADDFARAIEAARADGPNKTVVASIFGPHPPTIAEDGHGAVPVFDFPDAAAYALGRVSQHALWRSAPEGEFVQPEGTSPAAARRAVAEALDAHGEGVLPPDACQRILETVGLAPVPFRQVSDVSSAVDAARELGYPVAVKAASRARVAKSEAAGLALDIHDDADLEATCGRIATMMGTAAFPVVVQKMVPPGVDVAVSVTQHPLVGPVLSLSAGGAATPVAEEEVRVLPLTDRDARRSVERSALAALLAAEGKRRLEDVLLRVATLVEAAPELVGLELNPIIVSSGDAGITDARLRVAPVERDPLPPVRRLDSSGGYVSAGLSG
jgi:acyl-CoA synthetase (NDP forming)/RimJ/RimL family protein N-acetyltransferase